MKPKRTTHIVYCPWCDIRQFAEIERIDGTVITCKYCSHSIELKRDIVGPAIPVDDPMIKASADVLGIK